MRDLIEIAEAQRILAEATPALDVVETVIDAALGHVLAETLHADRDFPPTDRSMMDGFAVRTADLTSDGQRLRITGEVRAGETDEPPRIAAGETLRIFTGAVVPEGADAVVMGEVTEEDEAGGTVMIRQQPKAGQHIAVKGENLRRGQAILEPGSLIRAAEIAALTSIGSVRPRVYRRPVVHVLSTGDEIVECDQTPLPHQVRNSNGRTLLAQLAEIGLKGRYLGIAPDTREGLSRRIAEGLTGDLLLITGGVSVGKYDLVSDVLESAGLETLFHGVSVKPGKPLLAGRHGACLVMGLPGNPVSTFTGFAVFVLPVIRKMMGLRDWQHPALRATVEVPFEARPGRPTYHLARITGSASGLSARRIASSGSGDTLSISRANGFMLTPGEGGSISAGSELAVMMWKDFHQ
jgi:molybdopterin molybdotransferase